MLTLERHINGLVSQSGDQYRCDPKPIPINSSYSSFCLLPVHTLVSFWTVYTLLKLKCNSHLHFTWVTCWAKLTECRSDLQMADKWLCKLLLICHGLYMWLTWHTSPGFSCVLTHPSPQVLDDVSQLLALPYHRVAASVMLTDCIQQVCIPLLVYGIQKLALLIVMLKPTLYQFAAESPAGANVRF